MSTRTLDFGDNSPYFAIVGRPRHLAWPVLAYRITVPTTAKGDRDRLNPFEVVVLDIIDSMGSLDIDSLATETCLPVDLVRNVAFRLRDRGLIDGDNMIIDAQRRTWAADRSEEAYTSALAFRELVEGRLLPYLHPLEGISSIQFKSVAGSRTLPEDHSRTQYQPPTPREICEVVTLMRRRSKAHARIARVPTVEQIRIDREPEKYMLDCQIAIQARDADYRIADPFGIGFSRTLEEVFAHRLDSDERLQEWMTSWRSQLSPAGIRAGAPSRASQPFDTDLNRTLYPNLVRALTPAPGRAHLSLEDIYACLEWALFYCCERNDPGLAIRRLNQATGTQYSSWLSGIVAGIGLEVPKSGFRPIPRGKFEDYFNQMPEMETVLAISLVQAEADAEHPMRAVAAANPDFLVRVRALTVDRGDRAHGNYTAVHQEGELESDRFMRTIVSTLLDGMQTDSATDAAHPESAADLRLQARSNLLEALGYRTFNRLGPSAQASLLDAERFWIASQDDEVDARAFVSSLYAALQSALRGYLDGASPMVSPEADYIPQAIANARRVGLGTLPLSLTSVSPRRIRATLQGDDLSLGASVIALLLTASDEVLDSISEGQPSFLSVMAEIHERRGHANQPAPMKRKDLNRLRSKAYTSVMTLLEISQGE